MNQQALSGVKVLELSDFVCGPYCTKLLSTMGAEVIKIEKPGLGDKARSWGPFPEDIPHPEKSGLYLFLNTGKSSITLDIDTATGLKIFKELLNWADVLIQTQSRREMIKRGLTFKKIHQINPRLVVTSITPFGLTGLIKDYKGNDLIAAHSGAEAFGNPDEGVMNPDSEPNLKAAYHVSDVITGLTSAVLTLTAIIGRGVSGEGQHIDLSQQEAIASTNRQQLAYYGVQGLTPSREFGRKKFGGFLYTCKDGYVVIWIGPHYPKVMEMMGDPEWSKEEIFANPLMRNDYIVELNQLITAWTMEHTAQEVNDLALKYGVPCSQVRNVIDLIQDQQLAFRNFWQEVDHPAAGKLKYPGPPSQFSATPGKVTRAPLLGEQNEQVYCQMLKYSREDLVRLRQGGII